jgi:hypothetical protein
MLGLVITLVASAAPALPAPEVEPTCAVGQACEADLLAPAEYATPAVIACRSTRAAPGLFGECDGTPHDASYRVSRFPDSEQRTLELRPARRDHRGVAACDALPPKGAELTLGATQPAAVYASHVTVLEETRAERPRAVFHLPSRLRDPPDRPPRV